LWNRRTNDQSNYTMPIGASTELFLGRERLKKGKRSCKVMHFANFAGVAAQKEIGKKVRGRKDGGETSNH